MKKSISSLLNLSTETLVVCPITGISYSILFPNLGIDFTFKSPFSSYENVEAILNRDHIQLRKLPKTTLAGIVLASLKYNNLISSHNITIFEANTYFQLLPTSDLIFAIKMMSKLSSCNKSLPTLSLDAISENIDFSTRSNLLLNFLQTCADIINPPPLESTSISYISSTRSIIKKKNIKTISVEDKKKLKEAVSILAKDTLTSSKMASLLFSICEGNNILTMDNSIRERIIDKLDIYETTSSELVISLLNKYNNEVEDDEFDRASDDFEIVKTRKSLIEILAERKASK